MKDKEFKEKVKESFKKAKFDVEKVRNDTNAWINYLNKNNTDLQLELEEVKFRLNELEKKLEKKDHIEVKVE